MRKLLGLVVVFLVISAGVHASELTLYGYEVEEINSSWDFVTLLDNSTANMVSPAFVGSFTANNDSVATINGGNVTVGFYAYDNSIVDIYGGTFNAEIVAYGNSMVNILGGDIQTGIVAGSTSTVNIYTTGVSQVAVEGGTLNIAGGSVDTIFARTGTVLIEGYDFVLGDGLQWDGTTILGTGTLSGTLFGSNDGFSTYIVENYNTASITAVPEPATIALLGLGGLALIRRKRSA